MRIIKLLQDIFIKKGELGIHGVFIITLMYIVLNFREYQVLLKARKLVTRYR